MKVTNFILIQLINTLKAYEDKKLPQKISYAIIKNLMLLENEYAIYKKQLDKIFAEFDDKFIKDDKGNITYLNNGLPLTKDEYTEEFNNEVQSILNAEVSIDVYTIDEELFNYDDKYDSMTAKEIATLTNILCSVKEGEKLNE